MTPAQLYAIQLAALHCDLLGCHATADAMRKILSDEWRKAQP